MGPRRVPAVRGRRPADARRGAAGTAAGDVHPAHRHAARACRGASTSCATRPRELAGYLRATRTGSSSRRSRRRSRRSPGRPTIGQRCPTPSRRFNRAAAPRYSTRSTQTAKLISGVEGRHAVILLTDGYDEHSTRELRRRACAAIQSTRRRGVRRRHRRRRRHFAEGRAISPADCRRHGRPCLLPVAARSSSGRSTSWSRPK